MKGKRWRVKGDNSAKKYKNTFIFNVNIAPYKRMKYYLFGVDNIRLWMSAFW